jgi:hypothetical protein
MTQPTNIQDLRQQLRLQVSLLDGHKARMSAARETVRVSERISQLDELVAFCNAVEEASVAASKAARDAGNGLLAQELIGWAAHAHNERSAALIALERLEQQA